MYFRVQETVCAGKGLQAASVMNVMQDSGTTLGVSPVHVTGLVASTLLPVMMTVNAK